MSGGRRRGTFRRTASFLFVGLLSCGGSGPASTGERSAATSAEPSQAEVLRHVPTGASPIGITAAFGSVLVVNSELRVHDRGSVTRIDPGTGKVAATIDTASGPQVMLATEDGVWLSATAEPAVQEIDPATDRVTTTIEDVGIMPDGLCKLDGGIWVAWSPAPSSTGSIRRPAPSADRGSWPIKDRSARTSW